MSASASSMVNLKRTSTESMYNYIPTYIDRFYVCTRVFIAYVLCMYVGTYLDFSVSKVNSFYVYMCLGSSCSSNINLDDNIVQEALASVSPFWVLLYAHR